MNYVIDESKCTGCTACKNICPQKCINMKENDEGFMYPVIDKTKCINCNLCKKICPVLNYNRNEKLPKTIIAYYRDEKSRISSSSGGIFSALAIEMLKNYGIVCGATIANNKVEHKIINNIKDLEILKGSKYVQSNIGDSFIQIKKNLDEKKKVLFVGTTCQVAGLYAFLRKDYENLFTCDLLCHGVPSPKVFEQYYKWLEKKFDSKIKKYEFRNKDNGWESFSVKVYFENGKIYQKRFSEDLYMKGFLQNLYLRKSCSLCNFKEKSHISDITLGDYWGSSKYYKKMNDRKGLSVLFINSEKGYKMFNDIKKDLVYKECSFEKAIFKNEILFTSVNPSKNRENFFKDLNNIDFEVAMNNNIIKDPFWKKTLKIILKKLNIRK